ncbi:MULTISPECIES: peroxiredoxin [unclassified Caulobacter]|uniref:peroxiredoxin n=1 Tax=unclassified Caulobacter TaxID=2648921 RepID=UPI0006FFAB53|nr:MULTISPECIES: redoxin domain-containing protein [unclassified Caulobacter]KQV57576.1 peroxiredoxin [Caulobacter sp. Root342]KQV67149.1 peroxiredoxin [Caulobacter sp. Root343]
MPRMLAGIAAAALALAATSPALAALKVGDKAPEFTAKAALAGKDFDFKLAKALKKGPVVLYFFPAAYTAGCTAEAHEFAEATPEFEKLGATVIGVTAGNVDRIKDFSKEHCRDKFAVAAADATLVKSYDVVLSQKPEWSNRTSYVIAPDHKVLMAYTDGNFAGHVTQTMDAVKAYNAAHKK